MRTLRATAGADRQQITQEPPVRRLLVIKALAHKTFSADCRSATEIVALPVDHVDAPNGTIIAFEVQAVRAITGPDDTLHIEFIGIAVAVYDRDASHFDVVASCCQPNGSEAPLPPADTD